jgi:hypothetical protein
MRLELVIGLPCITASQRRVPARKLWIWRLQYRAARASARRAAAVFVVTRAVVVEVVVLVLVVVCPAPPVFPAAAAAVVMPANASRSPQARIERRNAFPLRSIASRRPSGRDNAHGEHRSARLIESFCRG